MGCLRPTKQIQLTEFVWLQDYETVPERLIKNDRNSHNHLVIGEAMTAGQLAAGLNPFRAVAHLMQVGQVLRQIGEVMFRCFFQHGFGPVR